jgi:hypothetical protein
LNSKGNVAISKEKITKYYSVVIPMDVRIPPISPIRTDFFYFLLETKHWSLKKSVRIGEIGGIRTSIRITTE